MPNKVTKIEKLSRGCFAEITKNLKTKTRKVRLFNNEYQLIKQYKTSEKVQLKDLEEDINHCGGTSEFNLIFGKEKTKIGICYQCKLKRSEWADESYEKILSGISIKPCRFNINHR